VDSDQLVEDRKYTRKLADFTRWMESNEGWRLSATF